MIIETNNLVTISEYARQHNVTDAAIRKQINKGQLLYVQISIHKYIDVKNCLPTTPLKIK